MASAWTSGCAFSTERNAVAIRGSAAIAAPPITIVAPVVGGEPVTIAGSVPLISPIYLRRSVAARFSHGPASLATTMIALLRPWLAMTRSSAAWRPTSCADTEQGQASISTGTAIDRQPNEARIGRPDSLFPPPCRILTPSSSC